MIDITKKYRTRDGRDVTGLHMRDSEHYPIGGFIAGNSATWTMAGDYRDDDDESHCYDLIEVTEQPDTELAELRAFRDAAIAKYPDLDPMIGEVKRLYAQWDGDDVTHAIRVALLRGIEIGKEGA